jgi:hypothetical protein
MARIYQSLTAGDAQFKVALVHERSQADLLVYRVAARGLANGDSFWYITLEKQDATSWIYFTSMGMAEIKVFFVDTRGEAGWQTNHRLKSRL